MPALVGTRPTWGNVRCSAATTGCSLSEELDVAVPGGNGNHAGSCVGGGGTGSEGEADELLVPLEFSTSLTNATSSSSLLSEAMENVGLKLPEQSHGAMAPRGQ